jgi:2-iminobutanoate/2-iminopropanoate deaminase
MPRIINPRSIAPPASHYAHGIVHSGRSRRLLISGQVGIAIDGTPAADLPGQMEQAWDNLEAVLREAGMAVQDLAKIVVYATVPGSVGIYRTIRDRRLGGHLVAATYLEVAALASPAYLVEIEGEAICEDAEMAFLELPRETEITTPSGGISRRAGPTAQE